MREQKKKLMAMLGLAVANLDQPDTVAPALQTLGRRHLTFGTQAAPYEPVGAARLWTPAQGLSADLPRRSAPPGRKPTPSCPA